MRRCLMLCLVLLTIAFSASSQETTPSPLASMSTEELLALRAQIEEQLLARGYAPYVDLERAARGEAVVRVQERLQALGYLSGPVTGKFDAETQLAFKSFERHNGLNSNGLASREDQRLLFSEDARPRPSASSAPDSTPAAPGTEQPEGYGELDYEEVSRYPEKHVGEKVVLRGRVLQVLGDRESGFQLRLGTSGYDQVVYVFADDPGFNILDNDRLTIYAVLSEPVTYRSVLGQQITLPSAHAQSLVLR